MDKEQLRERLQIEIETQAKALEKEVIEKEELASLEMPEDSYQDLKKRIGALQNTRKKTFHVHRKRLLAVALAAVLLVAAGVGASGAKLFVPRVENRGEEDAANVVINNDEYLRIEISEKEAYEEIEDEIGILALRLGYKPKGMELESVYIGEEMGEALMEFYYQDSILTIYENKQDNRSSFAARPDGKIIDTIELFYTGQELEILEIENDEDGIFYQTQLEYGNAFYYLSSDIELNEFQDILSELFFENI